MQTFDDIPGVEIWPLTLPDVLVTIGRESAPEQTPAVAARWAELCRENPRLYDGPILAVKSFDLEHAHVHTARDRYARLAVFPQVRTGARLLAVTGLLTARDGGGRLHALAGRRGAEVSHYPGMWEFGPSGGLAVPPATIDRVGLDFVAAQLHDEVAEEIGLVGRALPCTPLAYVRDHGVMSDDIVVSCDLGELDGALAAITPSNWEYGDVRWVPIDALKAFLAAQPEEMIPTSRAVARQLGWLAEGS